jgi:peptidoglycan/LPS O-acetylase OafA/YrhL
VGGRDERVRAVSRVATAPAHARRRSAAAPAVAADGSTPTSVTGKHLPALDGLRAFAVAGVLAYHLGLGWASGGYLGVDLFFVLSGFLITSLLLEEWVLTRRIRLGAFWGRRARRLLPALFAVLIAIGLYVVLNGRFGPPGSAAQVDLSQLRGDALASLFYVANWHFVAGHQAYFEQFAQPSPLTHMWSLAIEEQFYLVWPPLLLLGLHLVRTRWRTVGVAFAVCGGIASAVWMSVLYSTANLNRVYYGTDTRIFCMLAGATVAMVTAARPQPSPAARRALHVAGPLAAVVLGVFWVTAGSPTPSSAFAIPASFMFHGGFLLCAVLAAVVIADARQVDRGPLGHLLSLAPLPAIGLISYGIYLWHWPVFVYLTPARTGLSTGVVDLLRIGLTLLLSVASYVLLERPIRRRQWRGRLRVLLPVAVGATAAAVVVATIPALAAPTPKAPVTRPVAAGSVVPGAGGYAAEKRLVLPPGRTVSAADPLRVLLLGDSVMEVAAPGIESALGATGEVTTVARALPGWGLSTDPGWRTSLPRVIASTQPDVIIATWSWDDDCTIGQHASPPCAVQHPVAYERELADAVRVMLTPGDGVSAVVFAQFPLTGPLVGSSNVAYVRAQDKVRDHGEVAWDRIVRQLPHQFPGHVLYLPLASSVLLDGRFTTWLPPSTQPTAPRARWVRVRMVDDVHLCPAGAVRYADALLTDLSAQYQLHKAQAGWWAGPWTGDPLFNDPPGACPDDHPSG